MTRFRPLLTALLPLALPLMLTACVSIGKGGKGPETLITLTPAAAPQAGIGSTARPAETIVVLDPDTDRKLAIQRIAVQVDDSNIAYLKGAQWADRPARLFRTLLAEALRAQGKLALEGSDIPAPGATRLAGHLLDLGYDARTHAVVVRYEAVRETPGGEIASKRFEASIPTPPTATAVAPALNRVANEVAGQVAEWMK